MNEKQTNTNETIGPIPLKLVGLKILYPSKKKSFKKKFHIPTKKKHEKYLKHNKYFYIHLKTEISKKFT